MSSGSFRALVIHPKFSAIIFFHYRIWCTVPSAMFVLIISKIKVDRLDTKAVNLIRDIARSSMKKKQFWRIFLTFPVYHIVRKRTLNHLDKWLNGLSVRLRSKWLWVGVLLQSLKLQISHRFEQGVPWHSGNCRVLIQCEMCAWHDKNMQSKNSMVGSFLELLHNFQKNHILKCIIKISCLSGAQMKSCISDWIMLRDNSLPKMLCWMSLSKDSYTIREDCAQKQPPYDSTSLFNCFK